MRAYSRSIAISCLLSLLCDNEVEVTQSFQVPLNKCNLCSQTPRQHGVVSALKMFSDDETNKSIVRSKVNQDQSTDNPLSTYISSLPFFGEQSDLNDANTDSEVRIEELQHDTQFIIVYLHFHPTTCAFSS